MKTTKTLLLVTPLVLLFNACFLSSPPDADQQGLSYVSANSLHNASDRVVLGTFLRVEQEPLFDQTIGNYFIFLVEEGFKGSAKQDDELAVFGISTSTLEFFDGTKYDLEVGSSVVLFLKGRARDENYPVKYGGTVWTLNGDPAIALLGDDDLLRFVFDTSFGRVFQRVDFSIKSSELSQ